jgi:hypothetical protein
MTAHDGVTMHDGIYRHTPVSKLRRIVSGVVAAKKGCSAKGADGI